MSNDLIKTQVEDVIYSISKMDLESLNILIDTGFEIINFKFPKPFLTPNIIFEHFNGKPGFIKQLNKAFIFLQANKNTHLISSLIRKIDSNTTVYKFSGNFSKHYLKLIIFHNWNNRITDCYDALNIGIKSRANPTGKYQVLIDPYALDYATKSKS